MFAFYTCRFDSEKLTFPLKERTLFRLWIFNVKICIQSNLTVSIRSRLQMTTQVTLDSEYTLYILSLLLIILVITCFVTGFLPIIRIKYIFQDLQDTSIFPCNLKYPSFLSDKHYALMLVAPSYVWLPPHYLKESK